MKNHKKIWNIHNLHVTSWLLKDIFWTLKFTWLATLMIIPTLYLTFYILLTEKNNRDTNITLSTWVMMNIFWMIHELHDLPYWPVQVFMFLGVLNTIKIIVKGIKNESNIS